MIYIILIAGFILLMAGADFLIDGSIDLAERTGIPDVYIGMTVLTFGTSMQICITGIILGLNGTNQTLIGRVIGINTFCLLAIFGILGMLQKFFINERLRRREFSFLIFIEVILLYMGADYLLHGRYAIRIISKTDGIILLLLFCCFVGLMLKNIRTEMEQRLQKGEKNAKSQISIYNCLVWILGGIILLVFGDNLILKSISGFSRAYSMHFSDSVNFMITTAGLSLPKFLISIYSVRKERLSLAIGTVIGSCIVHILFVLGISAVIDPIDVIRSNIYNMLFLCISSILVWIFICRDGRLRVSQGCVMAALYIMYVVSNFMYHD